MPSFRSLADLPSAVKTYPAPRTDTRTVITRHGSQITGVPGPVRVSSDTTSEFTFPSASPSARDPRAWRVDTGGRPCWPLVSTGGICRYLCRFRRVATWSIGQLAEQPAADAVGIVIEVEIVDRL
jgi:hypothetical protein